MKLALNVFLIYLFAGLNTAYPSSTSPLWSGSENVDVDLDQPSLASSNDLNLDQSWIMSPGDSSTLNASPDLEASSSSSDTGHSEIELVDNNLDESSDAAPFSAPLKISKNLNSQNDCGSDESSNAIRARDTTDFPTLYGGAMIKVPGVDSAFVQAGGVCASDGRTSPQTNSLPKDDWLQPPDCSRLGGNKRMAFCCEQGPAIGGQFVYDIAATTRRRRCTSCEFSMLLRIPLFLFRVHFDSQ